MIKRNDRGEFRDAMRTLVLEHHLHRPARLRVVRRYPRARLRPRPAYDSTGAVSGKLRAQRNGHQDLQIAPRPDEIARFRFSRALFGAHPGQVQRAILEVAATLERSQVALAREMLERRTLEKSLQAASTTVQDLQQQLLAVKAELSACQDRERARARELVMATAEQSRPRQATEARSDEIMQVAEQAAHAMLATARAAALEVLRSARAAAQTITRSVPLPNGDRAARRLQADAVIVIESRPAAGRGS